MHSERWHRRARRTLRHSLQARLVAVFLLLALALAGAFLYGLQQALDSAWRAAAQPLLADYVDRLVADIGSPPRVERAQALVQRLPITVRISGPTVQWGSQPTRESPHWGEGGLLTRTTADGHRIELRLDTSALRERPRRVGWTTLLVLLLLTALAYRYVRRLLRPLDDIRAGAQRFGQGRFGEPIPVRRQDELGQLAADVNAMAAGIHQMLEAKRGLLLAISHELRSPLTRTRLNAELLAESGDTGHRREALLRDLQEMADLVGDLLESERLGAGHVVLQRESTRLQDLVREATADQPVQLEVDDELPPWSVDRVRIRLLLRNLVDNALRHGASAQPPVVRLAVEGDEMVLTVRDFGPGVADAALPQLAEAFWRPDAARERATGGVGLGLYLCRLVVQAHGGAFTLGNARPGLRAECRLPAA
jgi:signal transduction histidine kinase